MELRIAKLAVLAAALLLLCSCSSKITQPVPSPWQSVPCEYRLDGDDGATLSVRAQLAEFDSAKIVLHTFCWTVRGDTLSREMVLYPQRHERSGAHTIFISDRPLPMNSVIRSVELFVKKPPETLRRRDRL